MDFCGTQTCDLQLSTMILYLLSQEAQATILSSQLSQFILRAINNNFQEKEISLDVLLWPLKDFLSVKNLTSGQTEN